MKRQRRREGAKAAATSDAPMEGPADIEFAGDMVVEMERFPSTFAEAARMKRRVGRLIPTAGDVDMSDYSQGRRTLTDTAHANLQTSEVTRSQLSARQLSGNTYASKPATHAKAFNSTVKKPPAQLHAAEMSSGGHKEANVDRRKQS